ncbi:aminotransferase class IV [Arenibacter sp. GZD96]|uniref:aminotransferase class IV n=1 Tax=Aurantibrevibacter litoralis TaxID=3106030 RepID=UPI002AFE2A34|nr:aminotransferase class IV [Arenibacter sp. GZD-96]MEA1785986.1 aminotransferase class IV [Arenibacter sp. GZD-96]
MVNFNGQLFNELHTFLSYKNRGLRYGDALFETLRTREGKIIFWEDHYLRLMASMRMLRMEIPLNFTMEFLEEQITGTLRVNGLDTVSARVRFTVFRDSDGLYLPDQNDIAYIIEAHPLTHPFYIWTKKSYEVELFKDFYANADLLSTLKTNNKMLNVLGSIYAKENGYQSCLLLNGAKQVVEALHGNLFLVQGATIRTPPISDGALNGIIRKKLLEIGKKLDTYSIEEASISPFDLQKADELFITNAIIGIQPITKYRKKEFATTVAQELLGKLNLLARLH